MIQVERIDKPEILKKKQYEWQVSLLRIIGEYKKTPSAKNRKKLQSAFSKYNHREIKNSLCIMFSGKCAYCESHIIHIGYGHIEHYQPKSKFPELCFDWNNLLLSCEICNSSLYKGDKFPDDEEGGPLVYPIDEDPDMFFYFEFDPDTGVANILPKNDRASTTEKTLGLNRPELVKRRSSIVQLLGAIAIKASQGDEAFCAELKRRCNKNEEYAAFARALAKRFNIK